MNRLMPYVLLLSSSFQTLAVRCDNAPPYRDELVSLHQSLVEIESITENEAKVGEFLIDYLTEKGLVAERQFLPTSNDSVPRFNVIAWPKTRPSGASKVVVTSHIDTVPPFIGYSRAEGPLTKETIIKGRGTADAKGSVATQITALLELLSKDQVDGDDVMLAFVVGEETGGAGMQYFSSVMASKPNRPRAAIFGEPTEGVLACGHKGVLGCAISVKGKSGHSGYPETGKSANEVLMRGMIKAVDSDLGTSDRYGKTTLNIGIMQGGTATNVIPDAALAGVVLRVAIEPEATGHQVVKKKLQDILTSVDDTAFKVDCPVGFGAAFINCDVEGFKTGIMNFGTDIPFFQGNHTRYLYGPGSILVSHTADEQVTLGDLERAVEDYKKLILHAVEGSAKK